MFQFITDYLPVNFTTSNLTKIIMKNEVLKPFWYGC